MHEDCYRPLNGLVSSAPENDEQHRRITATIQLHFTPYVKALSEVIDRATKLYLVPGITELQKQVLESQEVSRALLALSQGARRLQDRLQVVELTRIVGGRTGFFENIDEGRQAVKEGLEPTIDGEPESPTRRIGFRTHY